MVMLVPEFNWNSTPMILSFINSFRLSHLSAIWSTFLISLNSSFTFPLLLISFLTDIFYTFLFLFLQSTSKQLNFLPYSGLLFAISRTNLWLMTFFVNFKPVTFYWFMRRTPFINNILIIIFKFCLTILIGLNSILLLLSARLTNIVVSVAIACISLSVTSLILHSVSSLSCKIVRT